MQIAVLAVQGAFIEHEKMLDRLGVESFELRQKRDLERPFDGLILPGGESTVQGKLLRELEMFDELRGRILAGLPVLGVCAGLILLAQRLSNDESVHFGTLPVVVKRNAYGRQLGSFYTEAEFGTLGVVPMTFIRAPFIESAAPDVEILAQVEGRIVGVRHQNQIGISFHPELNEDFGIHNEFLIMCGAQRPPRA
ncbi:MAG: pyridoxal 5'-phosphate synthase glutaminase subunit PdxT [Planctomycetia bacterium]|nr:pyridoxal 5'-phosphate synthase glutaminase subunit PdxT [Planctomycetia bacterium]